MRLSCCAYSYRQALQKGTMSLPDFIRLCRDMDLDGVELTAYYFASTERSTLNALKLLAHREGLAISGTAIGTDFARPDAEGRQEQIDRTKTWIAHSVTLGAPTLRVFAGPVREGQGESEAFDNVVACLKECAEAAYAQGVLLALENHSGLTTTAEQTLRLLTAVGSPGLGLNLDFGNFGGDIYSQFAACAPYAVATHAKPYAPGTAPGTRIAVDYGRVREILQDAGYQGFLAIEYEEEEPAETAVPAFVRALRNA